MSEINLNFKIDDILTHFVPRIIMGAIAVGDLNKKLNDTEYTISIDYLGSRYGYTVKNGTDLEVRREAVENPMIHAKISEDQSVKISVDEKKIMTDAGPRIIGAFMRAGAAADLEGTVLTTVITLSENSYCYTVKNGRDIEASAGGIDSPMVRIIAAREDIAAMIDLRNTNVLLAVGNSQGQGLISRARFDTLKGLTGKIILNLTNREGKPGSITFILNNAQTPEVSFTMSMESMIALINGKDHPTQMFMSGAMQIDGDIGLAMQIQPLFV